MHNWFAIESEAEFRRHEWEQAVAREARAAQAIVKQRRPRWLRLPALSLPGLTVKRLPAPDLAFAASHPTAVCETSPSV